MAPLTLLEREAVEPEAAILAIRLDVDDAAVPLSARAGLRAEAERDVAGRVGVVCVEVDRPEAERVVFAAARPEAGPATLVLRVDATRGLPEAAAVLRDAFAEGAPRVVREVARVDAGPAARADVVPVARLVDVAVLRLDVVPAARFAVVPAARFAVVPVARLAVALVVRLADVPVARLTAGLVVRVVDEERALAPRLVFGAVARAVDRAAVPAFVAEARSAFGAARLGAPTPAADLARATFVDADAVRVDGFAARVAPAAVRVPRVAFLAPVRAAVRRPPGRIAIGFEPVEEPFASSLLM